MADLQLENVQTLLKHWRLNCRRSRIANYLAANAFSRKHAGLGIFAVSLSAVVGTSVFASLGKQVMPMLQITIGGMSVLAGVLAALQTFLKYGDRSSAHRLIGARYGALVREIDSLLAQSRAVSPDVLEQIRAKMDSLAEEAPVMPEYLWRRSLREIPSEELEPLSRINLISGEQAKP